ncbi:hypothetical protein BpHYR1_010979 [Brachionus plicatilis]|uniref:Uncharacterized protein n=1 Tax=Brachionus plicatilis TaxID=10195 RepID=A0A3M7T0Z4_BRAPC|nr:hypothetical protein BpHYR1_010979 [Brachionus plicatilis]
MSKRVLQCGFEIQVSNRHCKHLICLSNSLQMLDKNMITVFKKYEYKKFSDESVSKKRKAEILTKKIYRIIFWEKFEESKREN